MTFEQHRSLEQGSCLFKFIFLEENNLIIFISMFIKVVKSIKEKALLPNSGV